MATRSASYNRMKGIFAAELIGFILQKMRQNSSIVGFILGKNEQNCGRIGFINRE